MAVIVLKPPRQRVVAGSGYAEGFRFWLDAAMTQADALDGLSAQLTLTKVGLPAADPIVMDTTGALSIAGNVVSVSESQTPTASWTPGEYDFCLRVFDPAANVDRWVVVSDPLTRLVVHAGPAS